MNSPDYFSPQPRVERPFPGGSVRPPLTSLDFVIHGASRSIGDDFIRIQSFQGQESISQNFEYTVSFHGDDVLQSGSDTMALDFSDLLGKSATVRIGQPLFPDAPTGSYPSSPDVVFFNGIVATLSMQESGAYQCTLRPLLWRLSLSNHYRLFADMTIREVIESILDGYAVTYDTSNLTGIADYRTQDWLQAGETDFDFINNLLSKVTGYFYFTHDDTSHTVVIANAPAYVDLPPPERYSEVDGQPLFYTFSKQQTLDEDDRLMSFSYEQKIVQPAVRNILVQPHAAWEEAATASLTQFEDGSIDANAFQHYRVYQYGVTQDQAVERNDKDEWVIESNPYSLSGKSTCSRLKPGFVFIAKQAKQAGDRDDVDLMRPGLDGQRFVVQSIQHHATVEGEYGNSINAASAEGFAIEFNPHNNHSGSIYGKVVNSSGAVAASQDHGQLTIENFDYDTKNFRYGDDNTNYACKGVYVTFPGLNMETDPVWVKLAPHMQSVPEEGVTVLVSASNDDTMIPEIQQAVQQKGTRVIVPPNNTTENTNIGNSYSSQYSDLQNSKSVIGTSKSNSTITTSESESNITTSTSNSTIGTSTNTSNVTTSTNTSTVGTSSDVSHIGASNSASMIGATSNESLVGASNQTSLTGVSASESLTASTNNMNIVGLANSIDIKAGAFELQLDTGLGARLSLNVSERASVELNEGIALKKEQELEVKIKGIVANMPELEFLF